MTVLEIMIVLAIIGGGAVLVNRGFRTLTRADLVENATDLSTLLRRTALLSIENAKMHRVLLDLDKQLYVVERCEGTGTIQKDETVRQDEDEIKRATEKGQNRLQNTTTDQFAGGADPEEATKRVTALAAAHVGDKLCGPVTDGIVGESSGKTWQRALRADKGIKFKSVRVQHLEREATTGQVAIYFFPQGQSEKSIIELTDGTEVFSVYVYGLTGRVELRDGEPLDPDDHMLKNVMGDKDKKPRSENE